MKIAVTYGNGLVFQHFGHTPAFKIYEVQNDRVAAEAVVETNGTGHGALAGFLAKRGVDTLICGGIGGGARNALAKAGITVYGGVSGDADDAIRYEHTSMEYAPIEFPAVADLDITNALVAATRELGYPLHTGIVQCKDSFYGQHSPEKSPVYYELLNKWESWKRLGVKGSEMESATLFVVAAALGVRCGSCFHVVWNQEREKAGLDQNMSEDTSRAVKVSVEALKKVIELDRQRG